MSRKIPTRMKVLHLVGTAAVAFVLTVSGLTGEEREGGNVHEMQATTPTLAYDPLEVEKLRKELAKKKAKIVA